MERTIPRVTCHRLRLRLVILVVSLLGGATSAVAQPYITPFVGYSFGGDAACQTAGCEHNTSNVGVALGRSGSFVGFEQEFAYVRNFWKDTRQQTNVLTLMSNLVVGPRVGHLHPYVVAGGGLIKTRVDLTLTGLATSDSSLGWNIGGGLEIGGAHLGVRIDLRRLHALQQLNNAPLPLLPLSDLKLDFNRATGGLVLRF